MLLILPLLWFLLLHVALVLAFDSGVANALDLAIPLALSLPAAGS